MPVIKLSDGTLVYLPDPGEKPSLGEELLSQGKKVGTSLMTGLGETVGGVLQIPGLLQDVISKQRPKDGGFVDRAFSGTGVLPDFGAQRFGKTVSDFWKKAEEKGGMEPSLERTFVKGVGGALATPVAGGTKPVQAIAANLLAGGVGGVTADLGQRLAPEGLKTAGGILGGLAGGGLTGFLAGPKQLVSQADIRRELGGLPAEDWRQAAENVDLFNTTGARTATLAEAFPGKNRITALANRAANSEGGEYLAQRLRGREQDTQQLGQAFLDRLGPAVDENQVANATADAATSHLLRNKQQASANVTRRLAGIQVPASAVFQLYTDLRNVAATAERGTVRDAYEEVASRLLNPQNQPITNLQELSYAIKDLKDGMKNPLAPVRGGTAAMTQAIAAVEAAMQRAFPDYRAAMQGFAQDQAANQLVKSGPVGSLADKNPLTAGQTPVTRLNGLITGNSPSTIQRTVSTLGSPFLTQGNPVNPRDLAVALMQQKLAKGSTDPGKTVRGLPGSQEDVRTQALLQSAGIDPQEAMAPLRAADELQKLSPASSVAGFPEMRSAQALIRPFRTIDMMMTGRLERQTQAEIAQYLANPTREGLATLQQIAMFNPEVRRVLTLIAALRPSAAVATTGE